MQIITANPNIHGIGKVYKMTYFVKNYIPVIKNKVIINLYSSKSLEISIMMIKVWRE